MLSGATARFRCAECGLPTKNRIKYPGKRLEKVENQRVFNPPWRP